MKVAKDIPISEITLRKYEKPANLKERELVKKLCLTFGILQPGDSRDVMVDVLYVLLKSRKKKKLMSCPEIEKRVIQSRKMHKLPMLGIASSNIRRQLKRLKDLFVIEKVKNGYRLSEFAPLRETYEQKIEKFLISSILSRAKDYIDKIDEVF